MDDDGRGGGRGDRDRGRDRDRPRERPSYVPRGRERSRERERYIPRARERSRERERYPREREDRDRGEWSRRDSDRSAGGAPRGYPSYLSRRHSESDRERQDNDDERYQYRRNGRHRDAKDDGEEPSTPWRSPRGGPWSKPDGLKGEASWDAFGKRDAMGRPSKAADHDGPTNGSDSARRDGASQRGPRERSIHDLHKAAVRAASHRLGLMPTHPATAGNGHPHPPKGSEREREDGKAKDAHRMASSGLQTPFNGLPDALQIRTECDTPRDNGPKRKRLGWGQGLARLNSLTPTPTPRFADSTTFTPRGGGLGGGMGGGLGGEDGNHADGVGAGDGGSGADGAEHDRHNECAMLARKENSLSEKSLAGKLEDARADAERRRMMSADFDARGGGVASGRGGPLGGKGGKEGKGGKGGKGGADDATANAMHADTKLNSPRMDYGKPSYAGGAFISGKGHGKKPGVGMGLGMGKGEASTHAHTHAQGQDMHAGPPSVSVSEWKQTQKEILGRVDGVDKEISQLEKRLSEVATELGALDKREQAIRRKERDASLCLEMIDARKCQAMHYKRSVQKDKQHWEREWEESERIKEELRRVEAEEEEIPTRPYAGEAYDRKAMFDLFCEENARRAALAEQGIKCNLTPAPTAAPGSASSPGQAVEEGGGGVHDPEAAVVALITRNADSYKAVAKGCMQYLRSKREAQLESKVSTSLEYLKLREQWKLVMSEAKKRSEREKGGGKAAGKDAKDKGGSNGLHSQRSQGGKASRLRASFGVVRSELDEMRLISRLQAAEKMKTIISIPNMVTDPQELRWSKFVSNNGFVSDPEREMEEEGRLKVWSSKERKTFIEKYAQFPKDFGKIASFLEHRSVGDCIVYYYKNQKSEDFSSIRRKHQLKKRRLYSEAKKMSVSLLSGGFGQGSKEGGEGKGGGDGEGKGKGGGKGKAGSDKAGKLNRKDKDKDGAKTKKDRAGDKKASKSDTKGGAKGGSSHGKKKDSAKGSSGKKGADGNVVESKWTAEEQTRFVEAVTMNGKDFKAIAARVKTKSQAAAKAFYAKHRKRLQLDEIIAAYNKKKGKGDGKGGGGEGKGSDQKGKAHKGKQKTMHIGATHAQPSGARSKGGEAGAHADAREGASTAGQEGGATPHASHAVVPIQERLASALPQVQQLLVQQLAQLASQNLAHVNPTQTQGLSVLEPNTAGQGPGVAGPVQEQAQGPSQQPQQPLPASANVMPGVQTPLIDAHALQGLLASAGATLQVANMQTLGLLPSLPNVVPSLSQAQNTQAQNLVGMLAQMSFQHALLLQQQHQQEQNQQQTIPGAGTPNAAAAAAAATGRDGGGGGGGAADGGADGGAGAVAGAGANAATPGGGGGDDDGGGGGVSGGVGVGVGGARPASEQKSSGNGAPGGTATAGEGQKRQLSYWTSEEKSTFVTTFKQHGRDWSLLSSRIPGKTLNQIKTFYQNYKQKLGFDKMELPAGAIGPRKRVRKNSVSDEPSKKHSKTHEAGGEGGGGGGEGEGGGGGEVTVHVDVKAAAVNEKLDGEKERPTEKDGTKEDREETMPEPTQAEAT